MIYVRNNQLQTPPRIYARHLLVIKIANVDIMKVRKGIRSLSYEIIKSY